MTEKEAKAKFGVLKANVSWSQQNSKILSNYNFKCLETLFGYKSDEKAMLEEEIENESKANFFRQQTGFDNFSEAALSRGITIAARE